MTRLQRLTALRDKVKAGEASDSGWREFNVFGGCHEYELAGLAFRAYTGSLDAAKALHEALLPGWLVATINQTDVPDTDYNADAQWSVRLWNSAGDDGWQYPASGDSNPARAWLLAILSALIETEGGE